MNGLTNLYSINDINTSGNINSNSYEYSNALYFTGLSGNIQAQLNALSTNTIIYNTISGTYQTINQNIINNYNNQSIINNNIYGSISGGFYTINNTINNNQTYITNYLNSISGNIITINNSTNNNIITLSGLVYSTINNNIINSNSISSLSGLLYSTIINNSNSILSLSGIIYNNYVYQSNINQNYSNNILSLSGILYGTINNSSNNISSLSGLIYLSQYQIYYNLMNQNNINDNYNNLLNSLQIQVNYNKQTGGGNIAGNVLDGIATIGLGIGTAFSFGAVFASMTALQTQVTELAIAVNECIQAVNKSYQQINQLQYICQTLRRRTRYLDEATGNNFKADINILGNINQNAAVTTINNPFAYNSFNCHTVIDGNLVVTGQIFNTNAKLYDLIQF